VRRPGFQADRLSGADWLNAAASLALLAVLFAPAWFDRAGVSLGGWQSSRPIGVLAVVVCGLGLGVWLLTAARHSPAVPIALATLQLPLSVVLVVLIGVRVLFVRPSAVLAGGHTATSLHVLPAAYIGLALALLILAGVYRSLRREGVAPADARTEIETVW
jgi:hypothetical protein